LKLRSDLPLGIRPIFYDNSVLLGSFMVDDDRLLGEWDEAAESWVDFVREGKDYYREEMNNPATFSLIGNVRGKQVLDLSW
jgi:hypothetical protein